MGYSMDGIAINDAQIPQSYVDWVKKTHGNAASTGDDSSIILDSMVFEEGIPCATD